MYLGITRLYAVLHGTFVISCLEKISDSYETCDFPFSCFCRIDFRIVPPADRDAAIRYRGDGYRSGTRRNTLSLPVCLYLIANADEAPALQAIQESNMLYFFGLEHFQGGVQEAVDWSIGQFMDEYIGTLDESVPQWETEMEMAVESEARVVDTLLVYTISSSNYTGGAHGMYSINCHNYSIAGGYELALSDLFDAARQEALIGLIRNKLYEQFGVTGDEGLVAQGFFPEYISTTENFEVTEDGITFYYNPYDIGCYALGGVEVHITREEMQGL